MRTAGAEDEPGDGAGRDPAGRFACRTPAAAARIAHAVFQLIGKIRVARPVALGNLAIVLRALVDIVDVQRDRRAGRRPLEHAGEDAHRIRLLPLRGEARLAGTAAIQPGLDLGLRQRNAGRAAIDDAADGRPVAFAPGRDPEQVAEAVETQLCSVTAAMSGAAGFFMPMTW